MNNFILMLLVIFLVMCLVTYLLHRFFKRKKYIKYIPVLITTAAGIYYIYLSRTPSEGFQDIARIIMAVMMLMSSAAGILTGLFLDFIYSGRKR
jgi:hypothetical protein